MKLKINFKQTRATSAEDINSPNLLVEIKYDLTIDFPEKDKSHSFSIVSHLNSVCGI